MADSTPGPDRRPAMTTRPWCAVTLTALVLVTSACASTAEPATPAAASSSAPTAVTTAAPIPNPIPVNSTKWIDVTGQGSVRMDTTGTPTQFGPEPKPGQQRPRLLAMIP